MKKKKWQTPTIKKLDSDNLTPEQETAVRELQEKAASKKCDAMGHFGGSPKFGTCPKCGQPF